MHLTRESEYALLGLAHLVAAREKPLVPAAEVAAACDLPAHFLSKIFVKLTRQGVLLSERGRGSGYALARPAESVTIREIIEAVEGPDAFQRCLLWREYCHEPSPCPLHYKLKGFLPTVISLLEETTLADFVADSTRSSDSRGKGGSS